MTINKALAAALQHADPSITASIKLAGTNGSSLLTPLSSPPPASMQTHIAIEHLCRAEKNQFISIIHASQNVLIHMLDYSPLYSCRATGD